MRSSNQNSAPEEASSSEVPVIGTSIREAREQAGLTGEELARRLCMTQDKLEALEQGAFDGLAGPTYVRGYIRNACKELGLDAEPLLAEYSRQVPAASAPRAAPAPRGAVMGNDRGAQGGSIFRSVVLVAAVAAAGGYWWLGQQGGVSASRLVDAGESVKAAEGAAATPAAIAESAADNGDEEVPASQVFSVATPSEDLGEPRETEAPETDVELAEAGSFDPLGEVADQGVTEGAVQVEPVQEAVASTPEPPEPSDAVIPDSDIEEPAVTASGAALALTFSEESWVEVTDAAGNKLLAKLQPAGSRVELNGAAPFSVMLGNAAATTVSYGGAEVDSSPLGNRRTRKLTVGG